MADDLAIRIRDQIAAQIIATSYTIYTSRHFNIQESALPAVCVVLGDDSIEQLDFDRTDYHEQDFKLRFYASSSGDVDKALWNTIKTVRELLQSDPTLGGLVDDSYPVSIGEPEAAQGTTKFLLSELVLRTMYHD